MGIVEKSVVSYAHRFYKARLMLLKELGYDDYNQYLQSNVWRQIRETILSRDKFRCRLCGAQATEVHHRTYTKAVLIGAKSDDSLISLCRKCHQHIEFDENGNKTNPIHTEQRLSKELAYIERCRKENIQQPQIRKLKKIKKAKKICVICDMFNAYGYGNFCKTCIPRISHPSGIRQKILRRASGLGKDKQFINDKAIQAEQRITEIYNAVQNIIASWNRTPDSVTTSSVYPDRYSSQHQRATS